MWGLNYWNFVNGDSSESPPPLRCKSSESSRLWCVVNHRQVRGGGRLLVWERLHVTVQADWQWEASGRRVPSGMQLVRFSHFQGQSQSYYEVVQSKLSSQLILASPWVFLTYLCGSLPSLLDYCQTSLQILILVSFKFAQFSKSVLKINFWVPNDYVLFWLITVSQWNFKFYYQWVNNTKLMDWKTTKHTLFTCISVSNYCMSCWG